MLDEAVLRVLARLEDEDARERAERVPRALRSRAVPPATGRFLFSLVAPVRGCRVLEIGGSRGYSTLWLATAARLAGGQVVSLEIDPAKCGAWRVNLDEAGLTRWATLIEGDAAESLAAAGADTYDVVFLDAEKDEYERLFALARRWTRPGGVIVADNVLSHEDDLGAYSAARQADPALSSVTLPLDRGLEVTVVLAAAASP